MFFSRLCLLVFLILAGTGFAQERKYAIAIHGGVGTILKKNMTPEREKAYQDALNHALETGATVLAKGGSSIDAVVAAIITMEDSPLFNAGKGAVFTNKGRNELDASIMNGADLNAGAVAGVTRVKNPIVLAREVMVNSRHVLLTTEGAEVFAAERKVEMVDPKYFFTERRWQSLQRAIAREKEANAEKKHGTVGVVALDRKGNLAAGTSTGGLTNKRFGRVGDSPIIGAGTYANNKTCAVSASGTGEFFIRGAVAHDISALMAYKGMALQDAADMVIQKKLTAMGGDGGVVSLDHQGNVAFSFNTAGMYRGYLKQGEAAVVKMYKD